MAKTKITHLHSPADSKGYGVPKSTGEPRRHPAGVSPADTQKKYRAPKASGETPTHAAGVDISKKFSIKPDRSSRR